MKNTNINRAATKKVALALGELCEEVVFVGGAMVSLYIDDPYAEDIRPTQDIDLTFQITTMGELERIRRSLTEKGFREAVDSNVICRFNYEDLLVDVMSTQQIGWAPANQWFLHGFDKALVFNLEGKNIKILSLPYFLAAKLDAFFDRGMIDLYASKDLEDLVYLFNHTLNIVDQIEAAPAEVKPYLIESIQKLKNDESVMAAIPGHLFYENMEERYQQIKQKFEDLTNEL